MRPPRHFKLEDELAVQQLRSALSEASGWTATRSAQERIDVLDSFDWRVYQGGGVLEVATAADGRQIVWRSLDATAREHRERITALPTHATDLNPGWLRDRIASLLDVRALLCRATVDRRTETYAHTDTLDKTDVRLTIRHQCALAPTEEVDLGWTATVEPMRGYDRVAADIEEWLISLGLHGGVTEPSLAALRAVGQEPGSYSSKLSLEIRPEMRAAQAFRVALRDFLDSILANVDGTVDDIDPEFLHDLRVAVRRSRSILGRAHGVLSEEMIERFSAELRWIGLETTPARDFDVWCLSWDRLMELTSPRDAAALQPLLEHLARKRSAAHDSLNAALRSNRFARFVRSWQAALDDETSLGPDAEVAVGVVAAEKVGRALRTVLRHGRRIHDDTEAVALHDLRKRAKRLRYLLECFAGVLPEPAAETLVPELRRLQDMLGDFQDAEVQARSLYRFAAEMIAENDVNSDTLVAMGVIVARLDDRQKRIRRRYEKRFTRFDRTATGLGIARR